MDGKLYIVATPIGNLGDITFRAVEVLGMVDLVVAEDRSRALKLLNHLNIHKPLITINSYNEGRKAKEIRTRLLRGEQIALITGAGTPCISDPGITVIREACAADILVTPVPGASAAIAAVSVSGMYAEKFFFYGFLPQKKGKKKKIFREFADFSYPVIFFESPRRVIETLRCISEELPDRPVVVLKEMTKLYEEVLRGSAGELAERLAGNDIKGEYTIVLGSKTSSVPAVP
jgi:16S rRNA (cytidine1402-2'-O)-methyltransferase